MHSIASHLLSSVVSSFCSLSTKAMKIYALLVAQLLLSPSAAIADHERAWIQYENTPACCEAFGEHTEGGRRLASDHANVKFDFYFPACNAVVVSCSEEDMIPLKAEPCVKSVELDTRVDPQHFPDSMKEHPRHLLHDILDETPGDTIPYGVTMVQAEQLWNKGVTGSGVTVCVVDSGIDKDHEDFATNRLTGSDSYYFSLERVMGAATVHIAVVQLRQPAMGVESLVLHRMLRSIRSVCLVVAVIVVGLLRRVYWVLSISARQRAPRLSA
jgi:hypothetical protein